MQNYKRKITYFYQYHNGNVGTTAGFLKLEIRGDKVKIIINIQGPSGLPFKEASLYFYHEAGDHLAALKVDKVESINGVLTYQNRTEWQQLFDTGRDLYTFDGVAVVYNDSHYYIGDFQDRNRKDYELVLKEKRQEPPRYSRVDAVETEESAKEEHSVEKEEMANETIPEQIEESERAVTRSETEGNEKSGETIISSEPLSETEVVDEKSKAAEMETFERNSKAAEMKAFERNSKAAEIEVSRELTDTEQPKQNCVSDTSQTDVYEKCEDCPYHKRRMEHLEQADAFEKMLAEYPKLPMYGATELFSCVRIHPKDIGKLDIRNWKLGVNSFLTHGFYTYQYLLLGKMRFDDGSERPIIGVPGVFSNREKYLANMFGFDQFIPVKKTGVKTGEFGYWIVEISPYL